MRLWLKPWSIGYHVGRLIQGSWIQSRQWILKSDEILNMSSSWQELKLKGLIVDLQHIKELCPLGSGQNLWVVSHSRGMST